MKRFNQITVDLGDALHSQLEALVKSTDKTKSDLIKLAVYSMCNAIKADISISKQDISKLTSGEKRSAKKKPRSLTEEDHILISTWKEVFNLSEKTRIFAPAVLNVSWNARRAGLTQEELVTLIKSSPRNRWVRDQTRAGVAPPLSALLSEKMIPHLLMLLPQEGEELLAIQSLDEYKRDIIDKYWNDVTPALRDSFRESILDCTSFSDADRLAENFREDYVGKP